MALSRVQIGSLEHITPIIIGVVLFVLMLKYAKNKTEVFNHKLIHRFACFVALFLTSFHIYHIIWSDYDFNENLPLYLCSLMGLLIPILTYTKKQVWFEIFVFLIISGTIQGVVTPDIAVGFPSFDYFRYWIVHLGLLIIIFYYITVFNYKPTLKSVFKSYMALQVYVVAMMLFNYAMNANYGYLNAKPKSASIIDYLGDWPYYIIKADVVLLVVFLLIYGCFKLSFKKSK